MKKISLINTLKKTFKTKKKNKKKTTKTVVKTKKIKTIVFKKNMSMNVKKFNKIYKKKI